MAGVKGKGGPVPKRSSQRRRRNKEGAVETVVATGDVHGEPLAGEHSELAVRFWDGLRHSGQAQFYEPSDWAVAELIVFAIDSFAAKPSAMMLASLNSMMSNLLVTEGDRRRVKLELEREDPSSDEDDGSEVARLDEYRRRLTG